MSDSSDRNRPEPVAPPAPIFPESRPVKPVRSADSIILHATESHRAMGSIASVAIWNDATSSERSAINRRLVALGCRKTAKDYPAEQRFSEFVQWASSGSPVTFSAPEPSDPPPALPDAATAPPDALPAVPAASNVTHTLSDNPGRFTILCGKSSRDFDEAGDHAIPLGRWKEFNRLIGSAYHPECPGCRKVREAYPVPHGWDAIEADDAPISPHSPISPESPSFSEPPISPPSPIYPSSPLSPPSPSFPGHPFSPATLLFPGHPLSPVTLFPRPLPLSPVSGDVTLHPEPELPDFELVDDDEPRNPPDLSGITTDDVIGSILVDPIESALAGRARMARPPVVVVPRPVTPERKAESKARILMRIEAEIWVRVTVLMANRRVWMGTDLELTLARMCIREWGRMNDEDRADFARWCDAIGYRPGESRYGPLCLEEQFDAFIEECLIGVPIFPLKPLPPPGDDDGQPVSAFRDLRAHGAGGPHLAPHLPDPAGRTADREAIHGEPAHALAERCRPIVADTQGVLRDGSAPSLVILVHGIGQPTIVHSTADVPGPAALFPGHPPFPRPPLFPGHPLSPATLQESQHAISSTLAAVHDRHARDARGDDLHGRLAHDHQRQTDADPRPDAAPAGRHGLAETPARGFLNLTIGNRPYGLTVIDGGFLLEKPSGECHEVTLGPDGPPTCSCRDFEMRHRGLLTQGCKHLVALKEAGLIRPAPDISPIIDSLATWCDELDVARFFGMA